MAKQTSYAVAYVAKQTQLGTPVTTPDYAHCLTGGKVINLAIEDAVGESTSGSRTKHLAWRERATPGFAFEAVPTPGSIGLYLLAALGAESKSGSTPPYTHTFTPGSSLPYLTVSGAFLDSVSPEKLAVSDVRITELELSWEGNAPVKMSVGGTGCAITPGSATIGTPVHDESAALDCFSPLGGTFKFAGQGTSGADAKVTGGRMRLDLGTEAVFASGSILPVDVPPKILTAEFSVTLVIDDYKAWRTVVTRSDSGTTVSAAAVTGTLDVTFANPVGTGGETLNVKSVGVKWTGDLPDVSPAGETAVLELSGEAVATTAANVVTVVLSNTRDTTS